LGIVVRQSIKYSILSAIGSLVGALSVLFIYPLDLHQYGYANGINSLIVFAGPLLGFSCNSILTKFHHSKSLHAIQVFKIASLFTFLSSFILISAIVLFKNPIFQFLESIHFDTRFFQENLTSILYGGFCLSLISLLTNLSANYQRTVVPNLILNLGIKFVFPVMILAVYGSIVNANYIPHIIVGYYLLAFIALFFYVKKLKAFEHFSKEKIHWNKIPKTIYSFTLISGFTGLANLLANKLDIISLAGLGTLDDIGKYSIIFFIASFIEIPMAGISSISAPIIAKHFEHNQLEEVNGLFKKVSDTLFLSGIFLFTVILSVFQNLGELSGNKTIFENGLTVFYILGIAKLIDMVTSLNTHAISYSKIYHYNLYFVIISAVLNVFLSFYLTQSLGITGTALSILCSVTLFNLLKFFILKIKFDINPFSFKTLKIVFILGIQLVVVTIFHLQAHPILSIFVNGIVAIASFLVLLKLVNPEPELNEKLFSRKGILRNLLNIKYIRENLGL
jgi:O-antigen/teichoic acid export membrane protein